MPWTSQPCTGQPWAAVPLLPFATPIDFRFASGFAGAPPQWFAPQAPQHQRHNPPPDTQTRPGKYPQLNPSLAEDMTFVRFDIKSHPAQSIIQEMYHPIRVQYAMATPQQHIRLISKDFPWTIDIGGAHITHNLTCDDVWLAIWTALQKDLVDSEWGFIIEDRNMLVTVEDSVEKRLEANPNADKNPKRIDCLGDVTMFRGLEKDDEFAELKLLPGSSKCDQTWCIKLTS